MPNTSVIVLNVKSCELIELMYYRYVTAYAWWPEQAQVEGLLATGKRVMVLKRVPEQDLPGWLVAEARVGKVEGDFR